MLVLESERLEIAQALGRDVACNTVGDTMFSFSGHSLQYTRPVGGGVL